MNSKELILTIAKYFHNAGYDLFEVGGYVRDSILGYDPADIDLATNAKPEVTVSMLVETKLGAVHQLNVEHATVGLYVGENKIEVTTYRKRSDRRIKDIPVMAFAETIQEDLYYRDFTVNSIARDPLNHYIVDPYDGLSDLRKGVIRCVRDTYSHYIEDPLRMLRAIRLAAQLGFDMRATPFYPELMERIPPERIGEELCKMLLLDGAAGCIRVLYDYGLIKYVVPDMLNLFIDQGKNHSKNAFEHTLGFSGKPQSMIRGQTIWHSD